MVENYHLTTIQLEAGLNHISQAPREQGVLEMIVRRPQIDEREVVDEAELSTSQGLVGDNWILRVNPNHPEKPTLFDTQITIMNSRVIALLAQEKRHWPLAGDQLFIDMDLSQENMPPGTRLAIGSAVVQVSAVPHTGCKKFVSRFGMDAMLFVNSPLGKQLHLRGINARIIQPGTIHTGDLVVKIQ